MLGDQVQVALAPIVFVDDVLQLVRTIVDGLDTVQRRSTYAPSPEGFSHVFSVVVSPARRVGTSFFCSPRPGPRVGTRIFCSRRLRSTPQGSSPWTSWPRPSQERSPTR